MRVSPTATHAAHLLTRAAWVATPSAIDRVTTIGIEAAVGELLDAAPAAPPPEPAKNGDDDEVLYSGEALMQWFFDLAISSHSPALERLAWFWHGHFATSLDKVELPSLMHRQLTTIRAAALGSFTDLVRNITFDPAMNIWLDLETNVASAPNENYARELLELFTMGRDNGYTQADVVDLARAFTGISLIESCAEDRPSGTRLDPRLHDPQPKTVLGHTGSLGPDEVLSVIADRPETHGFIAERLWLRYAGTPIPAAVRSDLAATLARTGHIRDVLHDLLAHPEFYTPEVRHGLVGAPVETLVRTFRGLGLAPRPITSDGEPDDIVWYSFLLDQAPLHPPHVGGWPHNAAWLDAAHAGSRATVGQMLAWRLIDDDADTEPVRRIREAGRPRELFAALSRAFGVIEWSDATTNALRLAAALPDEDQRFVASLTTAFTSPEVTLS